VEVGLEHVEAVCECKREGMEMMPGLYTDRGEKGKRKGSGSSALAIDGRRALRE
jgi:hypothetical protein